MFKPRINLFLKVAELKVFIFEVISEETYANRNHSLCRNRLFFTTNM